MGKLTQSYVHGTSDHPLIGDTIGVHLDHMVALAPDRPALVRVDRTADRRGVGTAGGRFRLPPPLRDT